MALSRIILQEVGRLRRNGALTGTQRVVEIGAQQLADSFLSARAEITAVVRLFGGRSFQQLPPPCGAADLTRDAPSSRAFWEALGFEYAAVDISGQHGSLKLDLNCDAAPDAWCGRFDLLVNAGTTEHVMNQLNAWRVMHDLVRPGGIMLHDLPAAGHMMHGLMAYTVKFFWKLCQANGYKPLRLDLLPGGASPLHPSIRASIERHGGGAVDWNEPVRDRAILASLRKVSDAPFVVPLDVPVS